MSNEIKLVYLTGRKVTYIIRQPDGALRGPADRPLTETPPSSGYYINNDSPDLVVRDMIIIKDNEAGVNVAYGEWKPEDATPAKIINIGNFKGVLGDVQAENLQTGDYASIHKHPVTADKKKGIIEKVLEIIGLIIPFIRKILGPK
jgi:hypothetical protein